MTTRFDIKMASTRINGFLNALKLNYPTSLYLANEIPDVMWNTENRMYRKYVLKE